MRLSQFDSIRTLSKQRFFARITASLRANASAANGEEHFCLDVEALRRLPLLSLQTAAPAPLQESTEKDASVLILIHPYRGRFQLFLKVFIFSLNQVLKDFIVAGSGQVPASKWDTY
ncbi:hypothetical protein PIB30_089000 [Stylosanthes scabra]|uniref:Uncharacterized protein n=1 Tax=Stylosanthes scabra TaxID=79078 RepID=A0ABU6ZSH3_9FABA|nr:hypothetical protein [Stylosanthes scabra]